LAGRDVPHEEVRRESREPQVKEREEVGEPVGRRLGRQERQGQRIEERDLLAQQSGMAAVLAVDPERPVARTESRPADVPERDDLGMEVVVKEGAASGDDRPERQEDDERETGAREDDRSRAGVRRRGRSPASLRRESD
jgi:hypothetical protein